MPAESAIWNSFCAADAVIVVEEIIRFSLALATPACIRYAATLGANETAACDAVSAASRSPAENALFALAILDDEM